MGIRHEEVQYQNQFLCLKIWEIHRRGRRVERLNRYMKPTSWHYHKEVEFLLILKGEMEVFVPEERWQIRQGDVLLLGSSQLHFTRVLTNEIQYIVFQLDVDAHLDSTVLLHRRHFSERLRPLSSLNPILLYNVQARDAIAKAILSIQDEVRQKHRGYALSVSSLIKTILLALIRHDVGDILEYERGQELEELEPALRYVDRQLSGKLSVTEASQSVNLSYHHFLKRFQQAVGMTFTEYVNLRRIKYSEKLLLTEDLSIEEAAYSAGFSNRAHFYKMFQRHHNCTPRQFKIRMRCAQLGSGDGD